jgi:hypothetical protein
VAHGGGGGRTPNGYAPSTGGSLTASIAGSRLPTSASAAAEPLPLRLRLPGSAVGSGSKSAPRRADDAPVMAHAPSAASVGDADGDWRAADGQVVHGNRRHSIVRRPMAPTDGAI